MYYTLELIKLHAHYQIAWKSQITDCDYVLFRLILIIVCFPCDISSLPVKSTIVQQAIDHYFKLVNRDYLQANISPRVIHVMCLYMSYTNNFEDSGKSILLFDLKFLKLIHFIFYYSPTLAYKILISYHSHTF
jgi:hypothetical protein